MAKVKIVNIVGARPNFIKIAPIIQQLKQVERFEPILVHTGQHYDREMSEVFFKDLGLPRPGIYLDCGGGTHAQQTAKIMVRLEEIFVRIKPHLVIVVGDVNSTLAGALVAVKLNIAIAHIESGLRSNDRTMPEEINRLLTDAVSDYLFTTCLSANKNLLNEGISAKKIFFVGNVMIDTLKMLAPRINKISAWHSFNLAKYNYAVLTLHRPSNVDEKGALDNILRTMVKISRLVPVVFSVHPRTQKLIDKLGKTRYADYKNFKFIPPQGYANFLSLIKGAKLVMTDSGGIQEETTVLGIPCLTLRKNTERPITVTQGTNVIVGIDRKKIMAEVKKILNNKFKIEKIPSLWDGRAASRIVNILNKKMK